MWGFPCHLLGSFFGASSATFKAPNTATVPGRDPDIRRNVPTTPLLAPQPKMRAKNPPLPEIRMPKKQMHIIHIQVY